jgi:hypothetical protein
MANWTMNQCAFAVEIFFRIQSTVQMARISRIEFDVPKLKKKNSVVFSPQANYTDRSSDRRMLAKLVPTFADRVCRVVSATDPYGR